MTRLTEEFREARSGVLPGNLFRLPDEIPSQLLRVIAWSQRLRLGPDADPGA
jgi:hypothetical protein